MKALATSFVVIALTACATAPDSLDATKLAKAEQSATLDVSPISLRDGQIALCGGEFKAELEDTSGVFYRGPGNCFRVLNETYPGGIYITKPPAEAKYRLYYYKTSSAPSDAGPAVQVAQTAAPSATPGVAGAGAGIGAGIVAYIQGMNDGKLMLLQPIDGVEYARLVRVRK